MTSIIVPVLNEAKALPGLLAHLTSLRGSKEVVVVDGGSGDGTADIARAFAGTRVIEAPRGRGSQVSAGAAVAHGDALLVLHADCRLPKRALEQVEAHLSSGQAWGWFDLAYEPQRGPLKGVAWALNGWARAFSSPVGEHAVFARREVWQAVGGCPEAPVMEDLLLARRLRSVAKGTPLPGPVVCSSRRYRAWSVAGMGLRCALLLAAFHLGVPPSTLSRYYPPVR